MRHLLFDRQNPPRMTIWQRRRADLKRRARALYGMAADTWQMVAEAGPRDPAVAVAIFTVLAPHLFDTAAPEPGEPAKAWVNFVIQLVIVIVAAVVAVAMAPKPPIPKPAALGDFDVPTAEEGRPITKAFGEVWITAPNVLWYGDLEAEPIKKKGGKK